MSTAALHHTLSEVKADAPWWRGAVISHVYPLSFCDTNDDGYGDLKGVTRKLAYIASLGVDAVWISPFYTSPMRDFGYDVSDYCDVDPIFGSLADFDALITAAHALGLKVIIDQVYSHTSTEHAWFRESRRDRSNAREPEEKIRTGAHRRAVDAVRTGRLGRHGESASRGAYSTEDKAALALATTASGSGM